MAQEHASNRGDVHESWVLRYSGWIVAVGAMVVASVLAVGLFLAPDWQVLVDQHLMPAAKATAQDDVRARALGVAAALGAAVAAALAWGRLDISRQENRRRQAAQMTDRYSRAVELLGSVDPAVRLGALYSLEALAHDSPADRETICQVICSYVRHHTIMRDTSGSPLTTNDETAIAVRGVTLSAAGEPSKVDGTAVDYRAAILIVLKFPVHWGLPIRDLRRAVVVDLDLANRDIGAVDFRGTVFLGRTWFYGTRFHDEALFNETTFEGGADFGRAVFNCDADFSYADFTKPPSLDNYERARAGSHWFTDQGDGDTPRPRHHHVEGVGDEGVRFSNAQFGGSTNFIESRFDCWKCDFEGTTFRGPVTFEPRELHRCSFEGAQFDDYACFYLPHGFHDRAGRSNVGFEKATFREGAEFMIAEDPPGFERRVWSNGGSRWFPMESRNIDERAS